MDHTTTATPSQIPAGSSRESPPHRNWLVLALAAVLLIVAAGAVGWWIGSSRADTTNVAGELPEIIVEFYAAFVDGDSARLAALFTEDGGFAGPTAAQARSELSSVGAIAELWFYYVDYSDMQHSDVIADANTIVVVSKCEGMSSTHRRGSKTPFSAAVVDVFELRDGLIARWDSYFDYDEVVT